jgi:hypothetical protein
MNRLWMVEFRRQAQLNRPQMARILRRKTPRKSITPSVIMNYESGTTKIPRDVELFFETYAERGVPNDRYRSENLEMFARYHSCPTCRCAGRRPVDDKSVGKRQATNYASQSSKGLSVSN